MGLASNLEWGMKETAWKIFSCEVKWSSKTGINPTRGVIGSHTQAFAQCFLMSKSNPAFCDAAGRGDDF